MKENLNLADFKSWILNVAVLLEQNSEYLSELDSLIGDGDHGRNINRGFQNVAQSVVCQEASDVDSFFRDVSNILAEKIGGSCGALLGLFFEGMADASGGLCSFDQKHLGALFNSGLKNLKSIGGAKVAEKTKVDAL